ncbi:MAG: UvrD-helicase domain-containing protein [Terracidiphilus sp.]
MSNTAMRSLPPDQPERVRALDANRCVLVKAPAGSGKTDLLTRRFLRLLSMVNEPGEIVAITFTKAAAAEMRHRILAELERAAGGARNGTAEDPEGEIAIARLAARALEWSELAGWKLIDLPAQLRIMTIDAFCRELALQQPLLSGLAGGLEIAEQPNELYRRAARQTLNAIGKADAEVREAIEALLLWRDNSWQDVENQLVEMLAQRDRWMRGFVLDREPNWEELRERLERPFERAVREALTRLSEILDAVPDAREEILKLARFACEEPGEISPWGLAECVEIPAAPFDDDLDVAREAYALAARFLMKNDGGWRSPKGLTAKNGFPPTPRGRAGKARFGDLIAKLSEVGGLCEAFSAVMNLPPAGYTDDDWRIVQACFTVLRRASGELKVVFAETGTADYTEVAQIAAEVLKGEEGIPSESALAAADNIKHLLVDEFQDTSRKQHQLLERLIAAWPDRAGRTCFVVGDPMQSIYLFREADAELFGRVERLGLEIEDDQPLEFDPVQLTANFRTQSELVTTLNATFDEVFRTDDGSGVRFARAEAARSEGHPAWEGAQGPRMELRVKFVPASRGRSGTSGEREHRKEEREVAQAGQTAEIVEVICAHRERIELTQQRNVENSGGEKEKYRVAVLGRTKKTLAGVAAGLREAAVPFRAVDLVQLKDRPEVMDALALGRALMNGEDRLAWLGVLRAPWCGLALEDLHALTSGDDEALIHRPVPELMKERANLLSADGQARVKRLVRALNEAPAARFARPATQLGTWLEQMWLRVGGAACVDAEERANLGLLWRTLDALPEGEQDFAGAALDAALDKLFATPDPSVDAECGVQLMTIHASKGLEFEVVIVPELQAGSRRGEFKMLAWMERGVLDPEAAEEPTELLIAPFQAKGSERGKAKAWVDRVHHERERQEMRRILYVAATRAREELHLFARPEYKQGADGMELSDPPESLLLTAWPALKPEIEQQFEAWKTEQEDSIVEEIAASETYVVEMPAANATKGRRTGPRRLPANWSAADGEAAGRATETPIAGLGRLYERHEGGLLSRALGRAVHLLLQQAALLREEREWDAVRAALSEFRPRVIAEIRAAGIERLAAARMAERALAIAIEATKDPAGKWIVEPREEAQSEVRWAGVAGGVVRTVQADRVFRAGEEPLSAGGNVWWIVDYKTAHDEDVELADLRRSFAPQLEAYARVLRNLRGADAKVCAGLYYPRMGKLDWWEIG